MQVETFECDETASESHPECESVAMELVESMGLAGQQQLYGKSDAEKPKRTPYRKMTADEAFVYGQICPQKTKLEKYAECPIPLRVLQVAAHAKSFGLFEELWVWHRASPAIKDPVLMGIGPGDESWRKSTFILARWGEALDEWPALVRQAVGIWRTCTIAALNKIIKQAQADLSDVKSADQDPQIAMAEIIGKSQQEPKYYF